MKKIILLSLALCLNNAFAESVIYKCVNEKGKITYLNNDKNLPANCKRTDLAETANETILNKKQEDNIIKPQEIDKLKLIPKNETINLKAPTKSSEPDYLGAIQERMKDVLDKINTRNSEMEKILNEK
jgi:flagellar biogenesis protein FliO